MPDFDAVDQSFIDYKRAHPDCNFAEYYHAQNVPLLAQGAGHASLGKNPGDGDWWDAGRSAFKRYYRLFPVNAEQRVIEYGCGSLRVGAHYMKLLEPGHFFGLDITMGFIEMGIEMIGEDLLTEKRPYLAAIDEESLNYAESFEADLVFAPAVAFHVHPDEQGSFIANLTRCCSKPGATLIFDAKIASEPFRYRNTGWAWPVEHYAESLGAFTLDKVDGRRIREEEGRQIQVTNLVFTRR